MKQRTFGILFLTTCFTLMAPIAALFFAWFTSTSESSRAVWNHLWSTVLPGYLWNSVLLALTVAMLTLAYGAAAAYLVARYNFFGKSTLQWLVVLPFAFPPYLLAYVYGQLLQFGGPIHLWMGENLGQYFAANWPSVRNVWGCAAVFTIALFPYVYLPARSHFKKSTASVEEAARMLGASQWQVRVKILLPLAWPALASGVFLVLMEVLADYGTVEHLAVETLTTGIFKTWFGMGNAPAAAQLSSCVVLALILLLVLEKKLRNSKRYHFDFRKVHSHEVRLHGVKQALVFLLLVMPILLGFLAPTAFWCWQLTQLAELPEDFVQTLFRSLLIAGSGAACCVALGLFLSAYVRQNKSFLTLAQSATSGYAFPGAMLAMGVLSFGIAWENFVAHVPTLGLNKGWFPMLSGGILTLLIVYIIRFVALPFQSLSGAYATLAPHCDEAARSLGASGAQLLRTIHWPHLRQTFASAWFLVVVDALRELPATLILRPFGFETLPVRIYTLASDERLVAASPYALVLIVLGCCVTFLLAQTISQEKTDGN